MSLYEVFLRGARGNWLIRVTQHSTTARLFIYFVKMFGTSSGQESSTVSAENEQPFIDYVYSKILQGNKRLSISFRKRNCLW